MFELEGRLIKADKAAEYIRTHAERYGTLVGTCKYLEHKRKVVFSECFLDAEASTVAEREALAYASDNFQAVIEEIHNAWAEKATIETKIKAAELTVEMWRSVNAAHRRIEGSHT